MSNTNNQNIAVVQRKIREEDILWRLSSRLLEGVATVSISPTLENDRWLIMFLPFEL
jgi:hypothetical protein